MRFDDDHLALRSARSRTAVIRALMDELQREGRAGDETGGLRAQAIEESARLVTALEQLSQGRSKRPVSLPDAPETTRTGAASDQLRPHILVVEDDDAARAALVQGLEDHYQVTAARNGVEGLRAATEQRFDAIVTDMWMPKLDGVAMAGHIRRLYAPAHVPVVFLSGETAPERVAAGFSAGATSYMVKPVDLELLDAELQSVLDKTAT